MMTSLLPLPPRVLCAERPGSGSTSDDRIFVLGHAVVVLDGATSIELGPGSGGWYADCLGRHLEGLLSEDDGEDLRKLLAEAIRTVAAEYDLEVGRSPSSTVAIVRWDDNAVEALVLGDSAVVAFDRDADFEVLQDSRIMEIPNEQRAAYLARLQAGAGYQDQDRELMRDYQAVTRGHRNRDGGYWIAEALPDAAFHSDVRRWPCERLAALALATDGVSCGIDDFGVPPTWPAMLDMVLREGADAVLDLIHETELSDPDAQRWPRFKPHDDKALAVVLFDQ